MRLVTYAVCETRSCSSSIETRSSATDAAGANEAAQARRNTTSEADLPTCLSYR